MMPTYRTSRLYLGVPACQWLERFKKTGIIVQFRGVLCWLQNKYPLWLVHTSYCQKQHYCITKILLIHFVYICTYVDSIPHSNYTQSPALCHCLHACIRVLRGLLVQWDSQDTLWVLTWAMSQKVPAWCACMVACLTSSLTASCVVCVSRSTPGTQTATHHTVLLSCCVQDDTGLTSQTQGGKGSDIMAMRSLRRTPRNWEIKNFLPNPPHWETDRIQPLSPGESGLATRE